MKQVIFGFGMLLAVAGCGQVLVQEQGDTPQVSAHGQTRPVARPSGFKPATTPPATARTVDQFDTTSAEEKKAAAKAAEQATQSGEGKRLGLTVASLGDPTDPGIWIKTPLVSKPSRGRVVYPATGKSVELDLIPIDGPKTGGSRMSLAALRVIGAPLTDLPEVELWLN